MKKIIKKICPVCKKKFIPKSKRNQYDSRRCFKKNYYYKRKVQELLETKKFPIFKCPSCSRNIELSFDPTKEDNRWLDFKCPFCHILMVCVWDEIYAQDTSKV